MSFVSVGPALSCLSILPFLPVSLRGQGDNYATVVLFCVFKCVALYRFTLLFALFVLDVFQLLHSREETANKRGKKGFRKEKKTTTHRHALHTYSTFTRFLSLSIPSSTSLLCRTVLIDLPFVYIRPQPARFALSNQMSMTRLSIPGRGLADDLRPFAYG